MTDLKSSQLIIDPLKSLGPLSIAYMSAWHAPIVTKHSWRQCPSNPWFKLTLRAFRSTLGHPENLWKRIHSALDWSSLKSLRYQYHNLVSLASDNPNVCVQTVNKRLHRKSSLQLPTTSPGSSLADFLFFTGKIFKLRLSLPSNPATSSPHSPSPATPLDFSVFTHAS